MTSTFLQPFEIIVLFQCHGSIFFVEMLFLYFNVMETFFFFLHVILKRENKLSFHFTHQSQFPLPPLLPFLAHNPHTIPHPLLREGKAHCFGQGLRPFLLYLG